MSVNATASKSSFILRSVIVNRNVISITSRFNSNLPFDIIKNDKSYAILKLNKPPVNTLNLQTLNQLNHQFDSFEEDSDLKGVIITSSLKNVFSAGLDIHEIYECKEDRLRKTWIAIQDFWLKLYGSKKIYIAAINGHALAFGCVISMSCDYRIMSNSNGYKTGLNAVLLGIRAPFWFRDTMINTIGHRECEKALGLGKIYTPSQAHNIKLVDELVEEENLLNLAEIRMKEWCKIPTPARQLTKNSMRIDTINRLKSQRNEDLNEFVDSIMDPVLQFNLEKYLNTLKKK